MPDYLTKIPVDFVHVLSLFYDIFYAPVFPDIFYLYSHSPHSPVHSGVFKGRRARHLPRAPPYWGPPSGVTRINFSYFW